MCYWNLDLKFKAKLKLQSGNRKNPIWPPGGYFESEIGENQYIYTSDVPLKFRLDIQSQTKVRVQKPKKNQDGRKAILRVTSLKINKLLPMATNNMHIKFEIEIPQQTWVMLQKPCRLQTDGQTDRRTRWIQYTPPPTSLGRVIIIIYEMHTVTCYITKVLTADVQLTCWGQTCWRAWSTVWRWVVRQAVAGLLREPGWERWPLPEGSQNPYLEQPMEHYEYTDFSTEHKIVRTQGDQLQQGTKLIIIVSKKKIEWNICGIIHHENPSDIHRNFSHMYQKWQRSKMQHSITVN